MLRANVRAAALRRAIAVGDGALRRAQQRGENVEERGLAGAVRSEQSDDLAGLAGEGDIGESALRRPK